VKSNSNGQQAVFLRKFSKQHLFAIYNKTHFTADGIELNDLKIDGSSIYTLVTRYNETGEPTCRVSRIATDNGQVSWNRNMPFAQDSCLLSKIVPGRQERFYVVGERRSQTYFSKGFALRFRRNGQQDSEYIAPDSVSYQRTHVLLGGIVDDDNRLIALGNTNDFDTTTYSSSYFRAFTMRPGNTPGNGGNGCDRPGTEAIVETQVVVETGTRAVIYPNPAANEINISNLDAEGNKVLVVYTLQGLPVLSATTAGTSARMDISRLAAGSYVLQVQATAGRKTQSITFVVRR
jgi:hypothetical protein